MDTNENRFDLEERTAKYGEAVIDFVKSLPETTISKPLISQLVRSATSVGANYMEADCAESKKDFRHKIGICKKESKETMHWLRMIAHTNGESSEKCKTLRQEAHELTLIFAKIIRSCDNKK
jgi:four helix bundle protein